MSKFAAPRTISRIAARRVFQPPTGLMLCAAFLVGARPMAQQIEIGPAPGRLIDVRGRKLHFMCSGSGSPTIILEANLIEHEACWQLYPPVKPLSRGGKGLTTDGERALCE